MDIRAAEISDIIKKQIENYDKKVQVSETGTVLTAARLFGLARGWPGPVGWRLSLRGRRCRRW